MPFTTTGINGKTNIKTAANAIATIVINVSPIYSSSYTYYKNY